ncbi:hypothetical protein PACTADRAFT_5310 [Pachysolen tannophilus NRRL Y-2460]|uniref:Multicopper oxidase n=1 Tax=Pachysolen tannophilus NRRL Y-2460 TaxID=669874 RepID=A0A1E4TP54_PACTA|nr:hypothetical protein PACTADRAFT_5310 [Pachysolen tannophilus NRRL Y-2460]
MLLELIVLFEFLVLTLASETHYYNFNITYVDANPDGLKERKVIGINNEWPLPTIRITKNDRVVINVTNLLEDVPTSLQFHGILPDDSILAENGPLSLTSSKKDILPGENFVYDFTVKNQFGTFWYHARDSRQYSDGLRGLFIVEPENKNKDFSFIYDDDITLTLSEWSHNLLSDVAVADQVSSKIPIVKSLLFNETTKAKWQVQPGKSYYLRVVNVGRSATQYMYIDNHSFIIVEVDGVMVEPVEVSSLSINPGQRYGVLLITKNKVERNYRIVQIMNDAMKETYSVNWLVYDKDQSLPMNANFKASEKLDVIDDMVLKPSNKVKLYNNVDHQILLDWKDHDSLSFGKNGPLLSKVQWSAVHNTWHKAEEVFGKNKESIVLRKDQVIELVINNAHLIKQPFYLQGHNFQVLSRSKEPYNSDRKREYPEYPLIRDTVSLNGFSHMVVRFKVDTPEIWNFHYEDDLRLPHYLTAFSVECPEVRPQDGEMSEDFKKFCPHSNSGANSGTGHYGKQTQLRPRGKGEIIQPWISQNQDSASVLVTSEKNTTASTNTTSGTTTSSSYSAIRSSTATTLSSVIASSTAGGSTGSSEKETSGSSDSTSDSSSSSSSSSDDEKEKAKYSPIGIILGLALAIGAFFFIKNKVLPYARKRSYNQLERPEEIELQTYS